MPKKEDAELTKKILLLVSENLRQTSIAKALKRTRQSTSEKLKKMENQKLIKRIELYPAIYEITPHGKVWLIEKKAFPDKSSPPLRRGRMIESYTTNEINFHDFAIKIPIKVRGSLPNTKKHSLNNWVKETHHVDLPINLTISITTKSVILQFWSVKLPRNSRFFSEFFQWFHKGILYANGYLVRHGFKLDLLEAQVISQHIATQTADSVADSLPKNAVFSVKLPRKAASATGKMKNQALAWTDGTPDPRAMETNDLLYEEKMLLMPEKIHNLEARLVPQFSKAIEKYTGQTELYTKQIALHLKVEQRQLEVAEANLKSQKEQQKTLRAIRKEMHDSLPEAHEGSKFGRTFMSRSKKR